MAGGQRLISWLHPYSTSKVVLNMCTQHSWATTGPHPNWAGCHTPPLKEPDIIVGPTHPHWANVQERSPLAHARTSSAGAICHAVCPIQAHTRHVPVTPRPDTPAVGPETPDKTGKASLNPSLSLSTLTQLTLLSLFFFPELGSFPHCPTIDLHLRPPDRRFLL